MLMRLAYRMLTETSPRLLWKFCWNFSWKGMMAVRAFERRRKRGGNFPAFMVISLTNRCNLSCQGCWVSQSDPVEELTFEQVDKVIIECKKRGSYFFGLLGGEPLLYPHLFEIIGKHPECYFQIFTNGTMLTREIAKEFRRLGNVTPLISIEGKDAVADVRRGGKEVYRNALQALDNCAAEKLITGVATSVCQSNFDDLVSRQFVDEIIRRKVHYLWYYIYRPVGPEPCPELALEREQITALRRFMVDVRCSAPIIVVDAYWDGQGNAVCPGAMGLSHHLNPAGQLEFCPPLQFAKEQITDGSDISELLENSTFLENFRKFTTDCGRGCVILNDPGALHDFVVKQQADDSSGRGTAEAELAAMQQLPCHHIPDERIPEKHWLYRLAKKYWFFGFGAYG
jgi:MoaA/NifB/PqqE/SkfB family radical SAM enzyme